MIREHQQHQSQLQDHGDDGILKPAVLIEHESTIDKVNVETAAGTVKTERSFGGGSPPHMDFLDSERGLSQDCREFERFGRKKPNSNEFVCETQ